MCVMCVGGCVWSGGVKCVPGLSTQGTRRRGRGCGGWLRPRTRRSQTHHPPRPRLAPRARPPPPPPPLSTPTQQQKPRTQKHAKHQTVWELVWTTEKETLAIATSIAPLFRTRAGGIYQVIDVKASSLQNVITFPPGGAFVVDSSCTPDDENGESPNPSRLNFKFNAARLDAWGRAGFLRLPPVGQGWFDTVWLDPRGQWRCARDVRGDTLVVRRAVGAGVPDRW
jgi:hypothetical protein